MVLIRDAEESVPSPVQSVCVTVACLDVCVWLAHSAIEVVLKDGVKVTRRYYFCLFCFVHFVGGSDRLNLAIFRGG
jgi:hypothetical protein